jgi:hypothetical protein
MELVCTMFIVVLFAFAILGLEALEISLKNVYYRRENVGNKPFYSNISPERKAFLFDIFNLTEADCRALRFDGYYFHLGRSLYYRDVIYIGRLDNNGQRINDAKHPFHDKYQYRILFSCKARRFFGKKNHLLYVYSNYQEDGFEPLLTNINTMLSAHRAVHVEWFYEKFKETYTRLGEIQKLKMPINKQLSEAVNYKTALEQQISSGVLDSEDGKSHRAKVYKGIISLSEDLASLNNEENILIQEREEIKRSILNSIAAYLIHNQQGADEEHPPSTTLVFTKFISYHKHTHPNKPATKVTYAPNTPSKTYVDSMPVKRPQKKLTYTQRNMLIGWALHKQPGDIELHDYIIPPDGDIVVHREGGVVKIVKGPGAGGVLSEWELKDYLDNL